MSTPAPSVRKGDTSLFPPPYQSIHCPPILGTAIHFAESTNSNADIFGNTLTDTPRNDAQPDIRESHDPINLTHKINYHSLLMVTS